jgi:hypothetical protein
MTPNFTPTANPPQDRPSRSTDWDHRNALAQNEPKGEHSD